MKKILFYSSILILSLAFNCETNSENDLIDVTSPPSDEAVTYADDVKPIIDNNCIACHSNPPVNGAPNSLTTFEEVRQSTQNNLIQRISLQAGEAGFMPLGGTRLPQVSIDIIQQWADNGYEQGTVDDDSDVSSEEDDNNNTPDENSITYTNTIKAIIDSNCTGCHSNPPINGAPNSLSTFEAVRQSTQNNLIQRISLQPGQNGFMPLGGSRLSQEAIDAIQEWADNGYEE